MIKRIYLYFTGLRDYRRGRRDAKAFIQKGDLEGLANYAIAEAESIRLLAREEGDTDTRLDIQHTIDMIRQAQAQHRDVMARSDQSK